MAKQEQKKPNILILWGDDIGIWNISHFSRGMMGYQTPNIDRVAKEGVTFTDYYAQQSCTAGRACFITGQNPIRTGLTKVGMMIQYYRALQRMGSKENILKNPNFQMACVIFLLGTILLVTLIGDIILL